MIKPMTEDDLIRAVREELEHSEASLNDIEANRALAFDYYNASGEARGDPCKGRSAVVSNDIGDMIDMTLAQMLPAFQSGDLAAQFTPENADDEEQAEQESKVVSHLFMHENDGIQVLRDALFDSLLQRNCSIKTSWCSETAKEIHEFDGLDPDGARQLVMQAQQMPDKQFTLLDIDEDEQGWRVKVREETRKGRPKVEVIPPEEIRVNADHDSASAATARFVGHRPPDVTVSDLVKMGFDLELIEHIPSYAADEYSGRRRDDNQNASSDANRVLDILECWHEIDYDGDGVAELRHIILGGRVLLVNDEVTDREIITGSCLPMPHQFWGMSLFDKLRDLQDTKTTLIRQVIDNAAMNINQRFGVVEGQVNLDDLMTSRPGGVVRMTSPNALQQLPRGTLDQSTGMLLEYMDKMRTERAGAALDMTQANLPVGNQATAHGTERIITSMEQLQAHMLQNFVSVVRGIFLNMHRLLRKHSDGSMNLKLGSGFVEVDPRNWRPRKQVNVTVGSSMGERNRRAGALGQVILAQKEAMQAGVPLATQKNIYNSLMDHARFAGLEFPEQYWLDPESPEAQQLVQQQQQAAQQEEQKQLQMLQAQAQFQYSLMELQTETSKEIKRIEALGDAGDRAFEYEKMAELAAQKYTELELKYLTDVPGSRV